MNKFGLAVALAWLVCSGEAWAAPPSPTLAPPAAPAPSASPPAQPPSAPVVKTVRSQPPRNRSVAGEDVRIGPNEVVQDLEAFGGDVLILGRVEGNVHALGGDVMVKGPVQGNLEVLGGDAVVKSEVLGNVKSVGGDVKVEGVIHGDLMVDGGDVAMGDSGRVLGRVLHNNGAGAAHVLVDTSPTPPWLKRLVPGWVSPTTLLFGVLKLMAWAGAFIVSLGLLWLDRLRLAAAIEGLSDDPLRTFAWGAIAAVGAMCAAGVLAVTILGIPVAVLVIMLLGAGLYVGLGVGAAAVGAFLPLQWLKDRPVLQISSGTVILAAHSLLSWFGTMVMAATAIIGLGALVLAYRPPRARRSFKASPALGAFL